jgi:hypothetical protein
MAKIACEVYPSLGYLGSRQHYLTLASHNYLKQTHIDHKDKPKNTPK